MRRLRSRKIIPCRSGLYYVRLGLMLSVLCCVSCAPAPVISGFIVNSEPLAGTPSALALPLLQTRPAQANFLNAAPSAEARLVADWVVKSGDNGGLPFAIIDKAKAKVFIFGADGRLRGASFALLGLARGDDSLPGIGNKSLSAITPDERTTPAGRFVGQLGVDDAQSVFWIDYATSVAMHPVVAGSPGDHRFQRLASPSLLDKRITYGCVNVPKKFFYNVVVSAFTGTRGIVYVLPEASPLQSVFPEASLVVPRRMA
jgi:hypothetical protein